MFIGLQDSCNILIKLEFSGQNLEKYSNIKFYKKIVRWEQSSMRMGQRTGGETDGQT